MQKQVTSNDNDEAHSSNALRDKGSCRPPPGTTYLAIGQDLFSVQEYMMEQFNSSLHQGLLDPLSTFAPAAIMAYTDIQTLRGLDKPVDYGSGIEYADGLLLDRNLESVGLQLGLWLNGTHGCRQILRGDLNDKLKKLAEYLHTCAASQVFLRIGYEFDNPSFGYSSHPEIYVQAYRKIVEAVSGGRVGVGKVQFVWHSWANSNEVGLEEFYPGNDFVDWIGVSIFEQVYPGVGRLSYIERVLDFAVKHDKPTMIAESTPFGGIHLDKKLLVKYNVTEDDGPWKRWFQPVLDLIDRYDVAMWSYINCNWEAQPMWHKVGFGETRLSTNLYVMKQWQKYVMRGLKREFLHAGSLAGCAAPRGNMQFAAASTAASQSLLQVESLVRVDDMKVNVLQGSSRLHHFKSTGSSLLVLVGILGCAMVLNVLRKHQGRHHCRNSIESASSDPFDRKVSYGAVTSS